ncbi:MAG: PD-(D/E)XK nuclease family protein [Patescibacteria group bacterium]
MSKDKFSATWISHSSLSDYLKCPRAYYLKNMWKNAAGHKVSVMSPALALGQSVHEVVESLSIIPSGTRFNTDLLVKFDLSWRKVTGLKGGFTSESQEADAKKRGETMLGRVMANPGPLKNKTIKIRETVPYYWLSEDDNIILCGKIDWLEYVPESDSVNIIDFKTGKYDEDPESLQLPIYFLLAGHTQSRPISKAFYWYLDRDDAPREVIPPDLVESEKKILMLAKKIALARKLNHFQCPQAGGCRSCDGLEKVFLGKADLVGTNDFGQDVYVLP